MFIEHLKISVVFHLIQFFLKSLISDRLNKVLWYIFMIIIIIIICFFIYEKHLL